MPGFYGTFDFTIDPKGRIQIPSEFRKLMPDTNPRMVVMTQGPDRCIHMFTPTRWDELMDKLARQKVKGRSRKDLRRAITGPARDVMVDNQWRLRLPPALMEYAGLKLKDDVKITGDIDHIEVWAPTQHEIHVLKDQETYDHDYETLVYDEEDEDENDAFNDL